MESLNALGYDVGLVDPRLIKPIDKKSLMESAHRTKRIVTLEDNVRIGGFGDRVMAILGNSDVQVEVIAWPDRFIEHGSAGDLYGKYGLDATALTERIREWIEG